MTERKNFFRVVYDAMIESRSRQAEREIANYRSLLNAGSTKTDTL